LAYFVTVWKITILRKKIIFFPILGVPVEIIVFFLPANIYGVLMYLITYLLFRVLLITFISQISHYFKFFDNPPFCSHSVPVILFMVCFWHILHISLKQFIRTTARQNWRQFLGNCACVINITWNITCIWSDTIRPWQNMHRNASGSNFNFQNTFERACDEFRLKIQSRKCLRKSNLWRYSRKCLRKFNFNEIRSPDLSAYHLPQSR
jgi:hypothetical protein